MKKCIVCIFLIAIIAFTGCQSSTDEFLAYTDSADIAGNSIDHKITQADFFADDLVIILESENQGGDEQLSAGATLLINLTDQKAVYADHVYDKMYPASLTKLLTALVVLRSGELTDQVTISENAVKIKDKGARVCGFIEGDQITMEALLNSMLIYSGNDAAIAIAEHIGGSEQGFVDMMNKEATRIGATQSGFMNPTGLHDDNQYTTAYDIYLIFQELLKYDTFRDMINLPNYTASYQDRDGNEKEKNLNTTNIFLNNEEESDLGINVEGGLTGATNKAGSCCVLLSRSSNNTEYISILLNADDSISLNSQLTYLLSTKAEN